ncbi:hypothetical protein MUP38_04715 [Candidatus Bathyarchaeota archaeon]|nr:hypothetical protein [Candidatus Bathyarchaeota archaeon]
MKGITVVFAVAVFSLCIILPFSLGISSVSAQNSSYSVQRVDHQIEVMYSGHIVIRDTIHVTGQLTDGFLIGFPKVYGAHVLKGIAYDANGVLPISLNVPFEGHSDLYGASVSFPSESPQVFTVIFILSDLVHQNNTLKAAAVEFPAYPSLAKETANCNVTLVLPDFASSIILTKNDGPISTTNFIKQNLAAFTSSPANVTFSIPTGILQLFSVTNLNRVITLSPAGDVVASDSYRIVNNGNDSLVAFGVDVPLNASNIVGKDEFGRTLAVEVVGTGRTFQLVNATFRVPLNQSQSTLLAVEYTLPRVPSEQISRFVLNFDIFPYFDYYVTEASVTIVPPEGARFLTLDPSASLSRDGFQETLRINKEGVSHIDLDIPSEDALQITYSYNPLWLSFRPTLWVWVLAVVGCITVAFWKRPKTSAPTRIAAPKLTIGLSPDHIRAFTEAYEEKNRITSELKLLDVRAQKGKIPRRRYKVQRRTLEVRFDALSKDIAELRGIFRSAGGNYASLIRQLDAAETELNEVETNIKSVEARHRRGAISLEEYKKLLADYQRRKEKAETTVNGILLRIREEIR